MALIVCGVFCCEAVHCVLSCLCRCLAFVKTIMVHLCGPIKDGIQYIIAVSKVRASHEGIRLKFFSVKLLV